MPRMEAERAVIFEKRINFASRNSMDVDFIPVVVERAVGGDSPTLKLKAPANMTMLQIVDKIRARLNLPSVQPLHLVLGRGSVVAMSQSVGRVHRDNRSKSGLLHFVCATENTFGCIPPYKKPVKAKFPGDEALPFGAPEPNFEAFYENPNFVQPAAPQPVQAFVQQGQLHGAIVHLHGTTNVPTFQWFNIVEEELEAHAQGMQYFVEPPSLETLLVEADNVEIIPDIEHDDGFDALAPFFLTDASEESSSEEM